MYNSIKDTNKINWKVSMLCFWLAYFVVTAIGVGHTIFNGTVLKMETMAQLSQTGNQAAVADTNYAYGTAYAKTIPFHPLYNIIIWPLFAFMYFRMVKPEKEQRKTALIIGLCWTTITIVFDLFGWVLIKHPWTMSWKAFYLDYQPWITFVYFVIFISPFIGMLLYKKQKKKKL